MGRGRDRGRVRDRRTRRRAARAAEAGRACGPPGGGRSTGDLEEIQGRSRGRRTSWGHALSPSLMRAQGSCSRSRTGAPTCRPAWRSSRARPRAPRATGSCRHAQPPRTSCRSRRRRRPPRPRPRPLALSAPVCSHAAHAVGSCGCAGVAGGGLSGADARCAGVERLVGHGDGAERGGQRNDAAAHGECGGAVEHRHLEQRGVEALLNTPLTKNTNHGEGAAQAEARLCTSLPRSRPVDSVMVSMSNECAPLASSSCLPCLFSLFF